MRCKKNRNPKYPKNEHFKINDKQMFSFLFWSLFSEKVCFLFKVLIINFQTPYRQMELYFTVKLQTVQTLAKKSGFKITNITGL